MPTQRSYVFKEQGIACTFKKVRGSRSLRITVHQDGTVVVTAPYYETYRAMERFVRNHLNWLSARLAQTQPKRDSDPGSSVHYRAHRTLAKKQIIERVQFWNERCGFSFKTITVRNQKTCWGSCSSKGTLSFNYQIAFLPSDLMDYVIVHELCHLKELNHSPHFWHLVMAQISDCRERRTRLKKHHISLA